MSRNLESTTWYQFLDRKQQQLVSLSFELLQREQSIGGDFFDYGFIVFPMAKAYEGFLKNYLYSLALIDTTTFEGKRFRIGRALNPDISKRHRDEFWVYDDLEHLCGGGTARELWDTWLECRNQVFHYFPKADHPVTLTRAESYLARMQAAMEDAVQCSETTQRVRHSRQKTDFSQFLTQ